MNRLRQALVTGLFAIQALSAGALLTPSTAAQDATSTYTDPDGRFTMQWQAPWEIVRQDETATLISNGGGALIIPFGSVPLGTTNLQSCINALPNITGDSNETSFPVLAEGKTTWRTWVAYQNDAVGLADYFECQITPDGEGMALFVGGTSLTNFETDIEQLTTFLGTTIVQPRGEHAPALTTSGWRVGVVEWSRGTVYQDLDLATQDGKEWVVVVADITNQQASKEELSLKSFGLRDRDNTKVYHASTKYSNAAAATLGENPVDGAATLNIPQGERSRVVLVFSIAADVGDLALSYGKQELLLDRLPGGARFVVLRPPTSTIAPESATVDNIIDGRTVAVTLENGEAATVRLIGLDVPAGDDCYASQATDKLSKLAGTSILLEADDSTSDGDDDQLSRHAWSSEGRVLLSNELVRLGYGTATDDEQRFQAMLSASEAGAQANVRGLWKACEAGSTDTSTATSEAPEPDSPPTAADRAYLSDLQQSIDLLDASIESLTTALQDGAISESERNQLAWVFIGLVSVEKSIQETTPPARYESLQTAYLTALKPLTARARAEADIDAYVYGDATLVNFYDLEIDIDAMTQALDETTTLLAEATSQFEAAQSAAR